MWFCYFLLSLGALQVQAGKRQQILTETFHEGASPQINTQQDGEASIKIIGTGKVGKNGKTSLNINVQIGENVGLGNVGGMGPGRRPRPGGRFPSKGGRFPRPGGRFPSKGGRFPGAGGAQPKPTTGPLTSGMPTPTSGIPTPTSGMPKPTSGVPKPTSGVPTPTSGVPKPTSGVPTPTSGVPTGGAGTTTGLPTGGTTTSKGEFSQEEEVGLAKHNQFRKVHQVPAMTLNRKMCDEAKKYAEKLVEMGTLRHSDKSEREGQGENLSMGCSSDAPQAMETAVENWYNEVCDPGYDFNNGGFSSGTGHFTQVVWKASTVLGIGRAEGEKNGMKCAYIVGRYKKAGNMMGDFPENVPKGDFSESYCDSVSSKRKKYFDKNGKAVLINTPFTEVDIPAVRNRTIQHPPRPIFELLNSKKKKKAFVHGSRR